MQTSTISILNIEKISNVILNVQSLKTDENDYAMIILSLNYVRGQLLILNKKDIHAWKSCYAPHC